MRIVLFGAPGVGKGTQASLMKDQYGVAHISTGDALRESVAKGTEIGLAAKSYMDRGELVPDDVIIKIALERINQAPDRGFVLDGFPRTIPQAEALDKALDELGKPLEMVVDLVVPESEIVKRLSGRRVCPKCGEPYHIDSKKSAVEGICDKCGGELIRRDDDAPEAVLNRLKVYRSETHPLVEYYRNKGILHQVDASGSVQETFDKVEQLLNEQARSA